MNLLIHYIFNCLLVAVLIAVIYKASKDTQVKQNHKLDSKNLNERSRK